MGGVRGCRALVGQVYDESAVDIGVEIGADIATNASSRWCPRPSI